jgi:hypothetical protein
MENKVGLPGEVGQDSSKKIYLQTSLDGGETWDDGIEFDSKEEASTALRKASHSGADSYVNLRIVEK